MTGLIDIIYFQRENTENAGDVNLVLQKVQQG